MKNKSPILFLIQYLIQYLLASLFFIFPGAGHAATTSFAGSSPAPTCVDLLNTISEALQSDPERAGFVGKYVGSVESEGNHPKLLIFQRDELDQRKINEIVETIKGTFDMLPKEFGKFSELGISVGSSVAADDSNLKHSGGYDHNLQTLFVGYETTFRDNGKILVKNFSITRASLIHETGHYILETRLNRDIPNFAESSLKFRKRFKEQIYNPASAKLNAAWDEVHPVKVAAGEARARKDPNLAQYEEAEKKINLKYAKEFDAIHTNTVESNPRYTDLTYQELFCDALAVLYLDDPKAMYKSNSFSDQGAINVYEPEEAARDFTKENDFSSWTWRDAHTLFSPIRSYFWRLYKSEKLRSLPREKFIEILYTAIRQDLTEVYGDFSLTFLSPAQRNLRLKAKLDALFFSQ